MKGEVHIKDDYIVLGEFIEYIANLADRDKFLKILNEYFDLD